MTVELAAAEPELTSPVAIAWDADGFLFAAEMNDYPDAPRAGRVRRLEDRDGDGVYERSTVFAEGLPFPNGVMPCFDGVLVTAAPDIWFFRDTDGDGLADERRVVLTGFGEGNTQLRVNGPYWGLDNWIYAANGRSDGEIRSPGGDPSRSISIRRRDVRFRFRPESKDVLVEAIAGFSQFGLAHDDRGNRFPSWNTIPVRHVVLEQADLDRNPYLAETSSVAAILDESDGGRVYPISPLQARFNRESVDYFNASCGPSIFRGDWLPPAYLGNAFVCEPLTNLVHRRVLEPTGATFVARRVERDREFLASTDPAFRPVNLATGPDGALFVVDMYRDLVEHPDFVPKDLRGGVDFRRWHDRGRIWRVKVKGKRTDAGATAMRPRLGKANVRELVTLLGHPVGWWRDTAQRLLVERRDPSAVPSLKELVRSATDPLTRLRALWTLAGLGALDTSDLERAARDANAAVRENALRAVRAHRSPSESLPISVVVALAEDPSKRVRLQAALALGDRSREEPRAIHALVGMATRDAADSWMRLAILGGLGETALPFLKEWAAKTERLESPSPEQASLMEEAAAILGVRRKAEELASFLALLAPGGRGDEPSRQGLTGRLALLSGLGTGLERSGPPLHAWLETPSIRSRADTRWIASLWPSVRAIALSDLPADCRERALDVLVHGRPEAAAEIILVLLQSNAPAGLRSAAARALGKVGRPEVATRAIESWSELALATRRELLVAMLASPSLSVVLVDALERQAIVPAELDPASRDALLHLSDPTVRKRVGAILARSAPADRTTVIARYQPALSLAGDAGRGAVLFAKNCGTCHEYRGQGHKVGPDLSGIAGRPPTVLLNDILDPNRDVAPDFVALTVATERGQVVSGLLAEETATGLKLRMADGVEQTILRSEIAEVRSSGRSLMPEGIEQSLSPQGMADLLAYLRSPQQSIK